MSENVIDISKINLVLIDVDKVKETFYSSKWEDIEINKGHSKSWYESRRYIFIKEPINMTIGLMHKGLGSVECEFFIEFHYKS